MENLEVYPCKYNQLIFDKVVKAILWSKNSLSTNGAQTTGYPHVKKINLDKDLTL